MVGYVGVMGEQEGIDLLIDAVEHLVRQMGREDIQFVPGRRRAEPGGVEALAPKRPCGLHTFTGRAPDQDLFEVLSTMDIGVNPDRVNAMNDKSTMNKIMEYMSLGKAMVQFDVTEGRFSAQDASLYAKANDPVDLAEKIVELLDDPARARAHGRLWPRARGEELNWQHQITPLLEAYTQALAK
jgi:glycosyltransferase involved in cell wall biosynthesis